MKYLSEKTNKTYTTVEELEKDEKQFDLKQKEKEVALSKKKEDAQKVQDAYKEVLNVRKKYQEEIKKAEQHYYDLRNQFIEKYGSWHMTYTNNNGVESFDFEELYNKVLRDFFGW